MIRLLVADDHSILRKGLKQFFEMEADIIVAAEATNGDEVLHLVCEQEFDLLLLDMTMDGVSGADLIRRVKAIKPALPILVLSMHKVSQVAFLALKAGADGYITKDSEPEVLLAAIRKVASGSKYIAPILSEEIAYNAMFSEPTLPHGNLSSREFEVFRLLVVGRSINEIAQHLFLSNKTVSTYKTRIMEKMNLGSMADLVRYAVQHNIAE
jgi:DNA-binding NarL/FixJ family response regulator